jgi:hypothetical protein
MRRLLAITFVSVAATRAIGAPYSGSANARMGIQEDAWLLYAGNALPQRLATLDLLGVTKPAAPANPKDQAYLWAQFDTVLDGLRAHGITAIVTLWGAPRWANGGHGPNWLPRSGFGPFATAAARRYPWVHLWTIWNEPNTRIFSIPVSARAYVVHVLNPGYAALHAANGANFVAGGVTSPRKTASGMAPIAFMAGMRARIRPRVTIWFHQHMNLVWAWGPSTQAGRIYARAAGMRFYHHHWLHGTAPNWQNHHLPATASFTVELPAGGLTPVQVSRQVHAVLSLAAALRGPAHA